MVLHCECKHVKQAKNTANFDPVATYRPSISNYPCSNTVRSKLCKVVSLLPDDNPGCSSIWSLLQCLDCPQQATSLDFVMWKRRPRPKMAIFALQKIATTLHPKWREQQPKPALSIFISSLPRCSSFLRMEHLLLIHALLLLSPLSHLLSCLLLIRRTHYNENQQFSWPIRGAACHIRSLETYCVP